MKITVICRMSDDKVRARLQPFINNEDIEAIYLVRRYPLHHTKIISYSPPKWMRNFILFSEPYRFLSILYICIAKHPDVLYGIYFVPHGIYAAIAGWIFRKPVIQELIGTDRPKVLKSKVLMKLFSSADRISVRGSTSKRELIERGISANKIFSSPAVNVLDFENFKPKDSPKNYDLIYCGRMDENKQLDILISAVSILKDSYPELKMVFVGDGLERDHLEALTNELGLLDYVSFVGNQPNTMIPEYLNQSKIFVMSSAFEGLPVAMLEALSCGLPVVVPDVGDISDIAQQDYNACLVEVTEVDAYVNALSTLLYDEQFYQQLVTGAYKTRLRLMEEYTLERATADFKRILSEITR